MRPVHRNWRTPLHTDIDLVTTGGAHEDFLQGIGKDEVLLYEQ